MKILIVNTHDIQGGAARAAYRLHNALQCEGINSQMLVQSKTSDDPTVLGPRTRLQKARSIYRPILDALPVNHYKNKIKTHFSPAWLPSSSMVEKINTSDVDLVHLHWIGDGMMRIEDIANIKKPIVWSLHDMWAFTGGCHYDFECGKFTTHCGACPVLGSKKRYDLSYSIFNRKAKTFAKIPNINIVGISRWLACCAKNSAILAEKCIVNLPNPIDTHTFRPLDRETARDLLNLPLNKKLILFGAANATRDPRKGFAELSKAMNKLKSGNVELVVFGSGHPVINAPDFGFPSITWDICLVTSRFVSFTLQQM